MVGTYSITEKLENETKFACMVSFNSNDPEYYEIELPSVDPTENAKELESFIDLTLQAAADSSVELEEATAVKSEIVASVEIIDGKATITL